MKKVIILSTLCLFLICGCGSNTKLQDGKDVVVSFKKGDKEHQISAEELYEALKEKFGLQATVDMIDEYILEKEFKDHIDTAKETAKSYIDAYKEQYGEEEFLAQVKQYTSYQTIEAYEHSLYLQLMETHATEEYAKTLISDKDINNYYENDVKGDVEVYQILIIPDVKDDMTEEEKEAKEKEAQNTAKDIIKKLDASKNKLETFKGLVKEYSEDETSKKKDGNLGFINYGDLDSNYDSILDEAYKLKNGEYSKKYVTSELGYHVIYRNSIKDKEKLDTIKSEIIDTLVKEKISNEANISIDSIKYYRELYNMKINDSEINKQYGIYMNSLGQNQTNQ